MSSLGAGCAQMNNVSLFLCLRVYVRFPDKRTNVLFVSLIKSHHMFSDGEDALCYRIFVLIIETLSLKAQKYISIVVDGFHYFYVALLLWMNYKVRSVLSQFLIKLSKW